MNQRRILILLTVIIFVAAIVGVIVYSAIPRATIYFVVAPTEFTATINGKKHSVKNGDSLTVSPGDITVELSRDEFDSHTETFTIAKGETKEVLYALNPLTDAARALLETDEAQLVIQRIGGKKVEQGAAELTDKYPLLAELPIVDRFYKIVVCDSEAYPEDRTKFAICVRLFDLQAKQSAIDEVARRGYLLSDYEVIYEDNTYETLNESAGE